MHFVFDSKDNHNYEIVTPDGDKHEGRLSYQFLLGMASKIIDGLSTKEVDALKIQRRIVAIKLYRDRTGESLKDSKDAVDAWSKRNHDCCDKWPYCKHNPYDVVRQLDPSKLHTSDKGTKIISWKFAGKIGEQEAQALMAVRGFMPDRHGFFSFQYIDEDQATIWYCNREAIK